MWESTFMGIVHDDCRFVEEQLSYIIYESRFMDIIEFQIMQSRHLKIRNVFTEDFLVLLR